MKRLTKRINGRAYRRDCNETCDTCTSCECFDIEDMVDKLCDYEDVEEQGRLVVLPCKVGDKYYHIVKTCTCGGYETKGKHFPIEYECEICCEDCDMEYVVREHAFRSADYIFANRQRIGKTVFLTRESAEAKLREMEAEK